MLHKDHAFLRTILTGVIFWFTLVTPVSLSSQAGNTPLASEIPARGGNFRFEHLTAKDGLPSATVRFTLQDRQGFMWFATSNGLSRYDGYTFKTFHNNLQDPHSISTENIGTLYEDRQGMLWVGTWNGGLNVFDRTTEQFTRYLQDPDDPHSLSNDRVNVIFEDKRGRLWIGTDGGLNRFDPTSGQFIHYQHDSNDPHSLSCDMVETIVEDASGQFWVGTLGGGMDKFDPASGQFTHNQHDPQNPNSLIYDNIEIIVMETNGSLWIGTVAGLDHFDPATGHFTHYRHDPADPKSLSSDDIVDLYLDASGDVWIATTEGGLNILDPRTKTFTQIPSKTSDPYGFHGNWLSSIYADRSGALWISTVSNGVNRLDRTAAKFELYQNDPNDPHSLSPNSIWSILRDHSGTLWVATVGGGLNKLDGDTGYFQHYRYDPADPYSLSNDQVFAMAEDAAGALWLGTKEGLNRFDQTSGQFTRYTYDPTNSASLSENWVTALYTDRSGRLWVGTFGKGLEQFDPATNEFRHYRSDPANPHSLSDNAIMTFAEDSSGKLWIGTFAGGLNKFDPETGISTRYLHDPDNINSLINNQVEHSYLDPTGVLWLATPGGLDKFDTHTETFTHYAEKEGLATKAIASVIGDAQGNLWVGMQGSGLARFDPRSQTFRNYDQSDGLQSNDFMPRGAYRDVDGKLYFGGVNGLNAFYPDQLRDNSYVPPVVLTDFQIFNRAVSIGGTDSPLQKVINETDKITLSHQQSVFSFEFAALGYRAPQKNQYAYKLEGFDTDWNYVGSDRRFATYTNLDPGTYTFRVKASNNDGVWNETGKTIKITITPAWWETWWFYTLCAAGILGVFGVIYQAKVDQLKAERQTALVLRESEAHYRELADSITDVFFALDNELRCTYWNKASERLTGIPEQTAIGKSLYDLFSDAPKTGKEEQVYLEVLRVKQPQTFVADYLLGEKKFIFEVTVYPSRGGVAVVAMDITGRKQAETERERLIVELENRNAELERFTYTVSHDLKSPLVTITGFLGYLEKDALAGNVDKVQVEIQRIAQAAEKMRLLLQELLELSRIGRLMNPPEDISPGRLVQEALKLLEGRLHERNIEIKVQDDLPMLFGDSQRLLEVIQNLLDNAVKFMGEQPQPVIEIGTAGEENGMPILYVRDNGIGIASKYHERIFGLFNKLNPIAEGTGIGLAIVKRIVEVHGGRVWVESEEGKGATFFFTFGKGKPSL